MNKRSNKPDFTKESTNGFLLYTADTWENPFERTYLKKNIKKQAQGTGWISTIYS